MTQPAGAQPAGAQPEGVRPTAPLEPRLAARLIDLAVAVALGWVMVAVGAPNVVGPLAGGLFLLLSDAVGAPGKRLNQLLLETADGASVRISAQRSALRNLPLVLGFLPQRLYHALHREEWSHVGWAGFVGEHLSALLPLVVTAVLVLGIELWLVNRDPAGRRLGDRWAGTRVVSGTPGSAPVSTPRGDA